MQVEINALRNEVKQNNKGFKQIQQEFKNLQAKVEQQPRFGAVKNEQEEVKQQDVRKMVKKEKLPERTALEKEVIQLIEEEPSEALPGVLKTYKRSKKPTLEVLQRVLNEIGENDKVVDPAARIEEWSIGNSKYKGLKMPNGKKGGVVREVWNGFG